MQLSDTSKETTVIIGAGHAGAAEHYSDVIVEDVLGDALPQQLHGGTVAVFFLDAGASEFERRALPMNYAPDIIFIGRVETTLLLGDRTAEKAVGADNAAWQIRALGIDHQKVVADLIETIKIPTLGLCLGRRYCGHLIIENAIAKRLRGLYLFGGIRQTSD